MFSSSPIIEESLQHGQSVAKCAMDLFYGLKTLHNLGDDWAYILQKGANLHDIGWLYGKRAHHKTSAAMIRAGQVEKVPKDIRHLVALVARYHRRAAPCVKHWRFMALSNKEQESIRYLAAIIRLADALDFSHNSCVQGVLVHITDDMVHLMIDCDCDCRAEINRVQTKKDLFVQVFNRDVCAYKAT